MRKPIVGIMGTGNEATAFDCQLAFELGRLVAQQGWILLTGGRDVGVMDAASRGAKAANGLTIGILPGENDEGMSAAIDIPIMTGIGSARNNINVLTSNVIIACGIGAGTTSEIALALKARKSVILLCPDEKTQTFFQSLAPQQVFVVSTPVAAIEIAAQMITNLGLQMNDPR
ncbi:MAG TPA: cytochrome [Trichocoleus sp.]|jgi:uncharacterized protein (TIGR00725 family)